MNDDYRKIPEGPRGRNFVEEESNPRIESALTPMPPVNCTHSMQDWYVNASDVHILYCSECEEVIRERWHMSGPNGRVFIMYGCQLEVIERAVKLGYTDVTPSGYWTSRGNRIIDPKDGPTSFMDRRPSGGGSRG